MLTHASNMAAILYVCCVLLVSFTRENRAASFQVLHRRIGVAGIGAGQPTTAEHATYWTTWGLYHRRDT
jgi:hypothetical protein